MTIRIGFCTNTLRPAHGVTHWLKTLHKYAAGKYEISGLLFTGPYGEITKEAIGWFPRVPIFIAPDVDESGRFPALPTNDREIQGFHSCQAALYALSDRCDVILSWLNLHDVKERPNKPLVLVNHHGGWSSPPKWNGGVFSHFAAVSQYAAGLLRVDQPVEVIYPGIDTERLQTTPSGADAWRERWGLDASHLIVMSLGRASADKNPREIAAAAAEGGPWWRCVFVGDLPDMRSWNEAERAVVIHQPFTEQLGDILTAANVVAVPSNKEACCQAIFESWYVGTPVVGTRVGAIPELEQNSGGFPGFYDTGEHGHTHLKRLLHDSVTRDVRGEQLLVKDRFTGQLMAKKWADYLTRISAKPAIPQYQTPTHEQPDVPPAYRANSEAKLSIAAAGPSLLNGGAERWLLSLASRTQNIFQWIGYGIVNGGPSDPQITSRLQQLMPLWGLPPNEREFHLHCHEHITRVSAKAMWRGLEADILLVWGLPDCDQQIPADFPGQIVVIGHGTSNWTSTVMSAGRRRGAHLVAVSEKSRQMTCLATDDVTVLMNGIEPAHCEATADERENFRKLLGVSAQDILVGYLGRISSEKNPTAAAAAVSQLPYNFKAFYVGEGYFNDADELEQTIARLAGNRFIRLPRQAQIGPALSACDVYMLASHTEGCSLGLLEAFYAGKPVVATRVGAVDELEQRVGQLVVSVPLNPSPSELAQAVQQALAPTHTPVLARAREVVMKEYLAEHAAQRWVQYLTGLNQPTAPVKAATPGHITNRTADISIIMMISRPQLAKEAWEAIQSLCPHYRELLLGVAPFVHESVREYFAAVPRCRFAVEGTHDPEDAGRVRFGLLDQAQGDWIINCDDDDLWLRLPELTNVPAEAGFLTGQGLYLTFYLAQDDPGFCQRRVPGVIERPADADKTVGSHWLLRRQAWQSISSQIDRSWWFSDYRLVWHLLKAGWRVQSSPFLHGIVRSYKHAYPKGPQWQWKNYVKLLEQGQPLPMYRESTPVNNHLPPHPTAIGPPDDHATKSPQLPVNQQQATAKHGQRSFPR